MLRHLLKFDTDERTRRIAPERNLYMPIGYYNSANNQAAGVVADTNFVADGTFVPKNNHPVFSEQYELVAATAFGATVTAAQLDSPTIDAFNPMQIYPVNIGLAPIANPNVMDLRESPIQIPLNEELKFQIAGGAGGAEPDLGVIWIHATGPGAIEYPIQRNTLQNPRFIAIFTSTIVLTAGVWSPFVAVNFTNPLRGGIYQLNALWLVCAHGIAYQINLPRQPMYQGRKLFPGNLTDTTYGNQIMRFGGTWMNGLGKFNSFENFLIRVLAGTTTGSTTYTGYADLTYLSASGMDTTPI